MKSADKKSDIINGLIVREHEPLNLEMPFSTLSGYTTPNESFYVRCHFPVPEISAADWRLKIGGEVEAPFELNHEELLGMESRTIAATLECAGNNRDFLEPKVKGVQWGLGAVGNASWTGVPLSALLERAQVKSGAVEVILEGADEGEIANPPRPAGKINFARSLPLEKAVNDVLLAHTMNGEKLTPPHGFPLRAIVPGWYAMASVKWLRRIIVTAKPFAGYYQSIDYAFWERTADGLATLKPLAAQQIKAEIAQPERGETVPAGATYRVHGAAWSGDAEITKVEVSTDSGLNWALAKLAPDSAENSWRLWDYDWRTPAESGEQTLMARATDSLGRTQPSERNADHGTYMINHVLPIGVVVR
ncbi:MAG TPA: sulfite oxidase [Chthoniobacterales bacterium]|nr:sulfite oxidase [Chthoniobacterales bacterium]